MRHKVKDNNDDNKQNKEYTNKEIAYILKESKNIRHSKDITVDIIYHLILQKFNSFTPQKQQQHNVKLTFLQKLYMILGILFVLIFFGMFIKNNLMNSSVTKPYTVIDDFKQFRFLNYYGKEKLIAATINEMQRICKIIDNCDDETMCFLLKPTCKNFLYFGPPGTGKTLFVKKLSFLYDLELRCREWQKINKGSNPENRIPSFDECMKQKNQVKLFLVQPSSLIDKFVGATEKNIRDLFNCAKREALKYRVIIFIDEIDAFFGGRDKANSTEHGRNTQNEFLQMLDGTRTSLSTKIFIFGATNLEKDMDKAFLRRMPNQAKFDIPDKAELFLIIKKLMEGNEWIHDDKINRLVYLANGMSHDEISTAANALVGKKNNFSRRFSYEEFEEILEERRRNKQIQGVVPMQLNISDVEKKSLAYLEILPNTSWTE